jgi:murein DD-endopeptidase MepM/ murein hydrolase activator NlpD
VGKLSRFLNSIKVLAWDTRLKTLLHTTFKLVKGTLLILLILSFAYLSRQISYLASKVTVLENSAARHENLAVAVNNQEPGTISNSLRPVEKAQQPKAVQVKALVAEGPLTQPVDSGHLVRPFGWVLNKDTGEWSFSDKVIIDLPANSKIKASQDGKVITSSPESDGRLTIKLDHGKNRFTIYDGLGRSEIKIGDIVRKGQTIGYSDRLGYQIVVDMANRNPLDEISWSGIQ